MNKLQGHHWYAMAAGPMQGGRMTRHYVITCSRCDRTASHHSGSLTDDSLRKIFIRYGWAVGRTQRQHVCPACQAKPKPKPLQPVRLAMSPPVAVASLEAAWNAASDEQRRAFLAQYSNGHAEPPAPPPAPEPEPEPEPEPMAAAAADDPPPAPAASEDGDAPADWWQQLHGDSE